MHTWKDLPRTVLAALGGVAAYLFGPWDALLVALLYIPVFRRAKNPARGEKLFTTSARHI